MKTERNMKTLRITLPIMGVVCALGLVTGGTSTELTSPKAHPEKTAPLSAKELTEARCLICHGDTQAGQARLAPPFIMVKRHYQSLEKKEFLKTVTSWVNKPGVHKSKMPGAINHFGLMPTFGLPEAEVKLIAEYVYNTDFPMPSGFASGGGQGGCGKGCGPKEGKAMQGKGGIKGAACGDCKSGKGAGKGAVKGAACSDCKSGKGAGKGAVKDTACGDCKSGKGAGKGAVKGAACSDCKSGKGAGYGRGFGRHGQGHGKALDNATE